MANRVTPFVKRMRTQGGTIYTFSSAVEDIGLNINERNNVVKVSNFALLNIPQINTPQLTPSSIFCVFVQFLCHIEIKINFQYFRGDPPIGGRSRTLILSQLLNEARTFFERKSLE